MNHSDW